MNIFMPLNLTNEVDKFLEIHNLPEQREEIENFNSPLSQSICMSRNITTRKVQAQRVSLVSQIFKNKYLRCFLGFVCYIVFNLS